MQGVDRPQGGGQRRAGLQAPLASAFNNMNRKAFFAGGILARRLLLNRGTPCKH